MTNRVMKRSPAAPAAKGRKSATAAGKAAKNGGGKGIEIRDIMEKARMAFNSETKAVNPRGRPSKTLSSNN